MAPRRKPEDKTAGLRKIAREGLSGYLDEETMKALLDGVLSITKVVWVQCQHCNKMTKGEVSDAKAVVAGLGDLVTKIADVPKEQVSEEERIVFERVIYMSPDGADPQV